MGLRDRAGAAVVRSGAFIGGSADAPVAPCAVAFTDPGDDKPGRLPEIDCIRPLLAADVLAVAEQRAAAVGVGADRVLIAAGALSEESYLRALAGSLGVAFEPLDGIARALCPIDDARLIESAAAGLLPLAIDDELYLVVAPRGTAARRIIAMIEDVPTRAQRFRFTSAERLNRFVLRYAGAALVARASEQLKQTWPMLSAAPPRWRGNIAPAAILGFSMLAAAVVAPATSALVVEVMLAAMFLAWLGLRLTGAFVGSNARDPSPRLPDDGLPVYSVIAALYREAACVDGLLSAIEQLDYPVLGSKCTNSGVALASP